MSFFAPPTLPFPLTPGTFPSFTLVVSLRVRLAPLGVLTNSLVSTLADPPPTPPPFPSSTPSAALLAAGILPVVWCGGSVSVSCVCVKVGLFGGVYWGGFIWRSLLKGGLSPNRTHIFQVCECEMCARVTESLSGGVYMDEFIKGEFIPQQHP